MGRSLSGYLSRRSGYRLPLALTLLLVLTGNFAEFLRDQGALLLGHGASITVIAVVSILAARSFGGSKALGLDPRAPLRGWRSGLLGGLLLGAALAAAVAVATAVFDRSLEYENISDLTAGELALALMVAFPLVTAIPEELAFRGVLLAAWQRTTSPVAAVAWSSLGFALWHLVVAWETAGGIDGGLARVGVYVSFLLAVTAAGAIFGLLRLNARGLAAPIFAHWMVVIPVRVFLWSSGA